MELTFSWKQWNILTKLVAAQERLDFVSYSVEAEVAVGKEGEEKGRIFFDGVSDTLKVHLPD